MNMNSVFGIVAICRNWR